MIPWDQLLVLIFRSPNSYSEWLVRHSALPVLTQDTAFWLHVFVPTTAEVPIKVMMLTHTAAHNSQHRYSLQGFSSQTMRWDSAFILFLLTWPLSNSEYAPYLFSETLSNPYLTPFQSHNTTVASRGLWRTYSPTHSGQSSITYNRLLQGWRFQNLPGQPVSVFNRPHSKNTFPYGLNGIFHISYFSLCPLPPALSLGTTKKSDYIFWLHWWDLPEPSLTLG